MSCCVYALELDGKEAVLKIPFDEESGRQQAALLDRWSQEGGAPRIHRVDGRTGVFLMARVTPGDVIEPAPTEGATLAVVSLMRRIHGAGFGGLPALPPVSEMALMRIDWADERFEITGNAAGKELARAARCVADELLASTRGRTLLHGDLQPKNMLMSETDGPQVIDPLGCIGPAVTDAALWAAVQDSATSIGERVRQLATLGGFDHDLLRSWTTVFAVAELRPYENKYSGRMAAYLTSDDASPLLATEAGRPARSLVSAAMANTTGI
jgi:streptomycin 6-kinase